MSIQPITAAPYATEAEMQADLADLAAIPSGMAALYQSVGLTPKPGCLFPHVLTEVAYPDPEAATAREVPGGKLIALDIETNCHWHHSGGQVLTAAVWAGDSPTDHAVFGPGGEADLLAALAAWLDKRAPATIVTWNGRSFDFPFLVARSAALGVGLGVSLARHGHVDVGRLWRNPARQQIGTWRLKEVARWHAIPVIELDCSDPAWTTRYAWEEIQAYNLSDVRATHKLAILWRAGYGWPRRTDLEVDDGVTPIAMEFKHRACIDGSQLADQDRLVPKRFRILVVSAVPATWSTWGRIRAISWTELAAGLRSSAIPAAIAVADRLDASVIALHVVAELATPTTPLADLLGACDAGPGATGTDYHTANSRLGALLTQAVTDAGVASIHVDVSRGAFHPPLITERVCLDGGVQVGFELQGHRRKRYVAGRSIGDWLVSLRLDLLIWRDALPGEGDAPRYVDALAGGSARAAFVAERRVTLAAAAGHFVVGAWGERAATVLGNRFGPRRYGARSRPDTLLEAETGIVSFLAGRPSFRSAGLSFFIDGSTSYGELVDLIRWVSKTVAGAGPVAPVALGAGSVVPDWPPPWLPTAAYKLRNPA